VSARRLSHRTTAIRVGDFQRFLYLVMIPPKQSEATHWPACPMNFLYTIFRATWSSLRLPSWYKMLVKIVPPAFAVERCFEVMMGRRACSLLATSADWEPFSCQNNWTMNLESIKCDHCRQLSRRDASSPEGSRAWRSSVLC
jgi:hypothetical protein